ncbi:hypothetical protein [Pseudomonas brassicacearum]|uniref:Bacterial Ig-like domain-containing protein n=1 Tax=Pseudomonas brassicacearum TaxID=930166 RepID=A0A423GJ33_9PSED|nr:hypothetical protein [Pseudomonas brassicacearum]ROM90064.1 hypothetical protein BK658_26850 [Pseudomonas brassicacearum]
MTSESKQLVAITKVVDADGTAIPNGGKGKGPKFTVSGTAEAGVSVTLKDSFYVIQTGYANSNRMWSMTVSLYAGEHQLNALSSGNTSNVWSFSVVPPQ